MLNIFDFVFLIIVVGCCVVFCMCGYVYGLVVCMVSLFDVGEMIKLFVFFDLIDMWVLFGKLVFGWYLYLGIVMLMFMFDGYGIYVELMGYEGLIGVGDIEWMSVGCGVWYMGFVVLLVKVF